MNRTSVICTVCERVIQVRVEHPSETVTYEHVGPADHEPQIAIVPEKDAKKSCDFCSSPDPRWAYVPTQAWEHTFGDGNEHVRQPPDGPETYAAFVLPWTCCDKCRDVVALRDPSVLVEHVCKAGKTGVLYQLSLPAYRRAMKKEWLLVHTKFFELGKPEGPFPLSEV